MEFCYFVITLLWMKPFKNRQSSYVFQVHCIGDFVGCFGRKDSEGFVWFYNERCKYFWTPYELLTSLPGFLWGSSWCFILYSFKLGSSLKGFRLIFYIFLSSLMQFLKAFWNSLILHHRLDRISPYKIFNILGIYHILICFCGMHVWLCSAKFGEKNKGLCHPF